MRAAVLVLCALASVEVHASAGEVLFTVGPVEIARAGTTQVATRGVAIEPGDQVSTGPNALAQLVFVDGARVELEASSRLAVDEYGWPHPAVRDAMVDPKATPSPADLIGRSVLRLLKGTVRTISGLIGKGDPAQYEFVTPVATIGIRGTDYTVSFCSGDCNALRDGLHVRVAQGKVVVTNAAGELTLLAGEYGYVAGAAIAPTRPPTPEGAINSESNPGVAENPPYAAGGGRVSSGSRSGLCALLPVLCDLIAPLTAPVPPLALIKTLDASVPGVAGDGLPNPVLQPPGGILPNAPLPQLPLAGH